MSDVFSVQPPAWLQDLTRSNDKGLLGGILGEIAAGGAIAATKAGGDDHKNWFQELPQSIAEAHLNFLDPTWKIKLQQAQLNIAQTGLGLQEMQQKINLNATNMKLRAEDTQNIPKWMADHPTYESRKDAEWPTAKTPEWNQNLDQLRLRDSQSSLAKITVSGLKELSDTIHDISLYDGVKAGELSAKIQPFAVKGQMPPAQVLQEVMAAREVSETKKFGRQKELLGLRGTGTPVAQKYLNLADQEEALAEDFRSKGDTANYQAHKERADNYRMLAAPKTSSIEVTMGPEGPKLTQTYGPKPTTAMATKAQEQTVKYEDATTLINQLQKTLRPADVGAAGVGGEMILDRTLAQFDPSFANRERIENRTALGALRESLLRQVSDDPRFSNLDRKVISELLPSTGVFESYPDAMARMGQVKQIIADRARSYAISSKSPVPDFAKSREEIIGEYNATVEKLRDAVKANRLTPQQAYEQAQKLHKGMQDSIERFH